jgi:hypothetical protein
MTSRNVRQRIVERSRPECPKTLMHNGYTDKKIAGRGSGPKRFTVRSVLALFNRQPTLCPQAAGVSPQAAGELSAAVETQATT